MTTMTHPHTNGRKRPSLSEQINRLDGMLDGLSEALNDAVADAVKGAVGVAVKEAVQTVLTEVLTNPTILAKLTPAATTANEPPPAPMAPIPSSPDELPVSWWQRVRAIAASLNAACQLPFRSAWATAKRLWQRAIGGCAAVWAHREFLGIFKYQIMAALAIGVLVAILVCYAGPWMGAITSGIGGFLTTLAIQGGLWLRKVLAIDFEELD